MIFMAEGRNPAPGFFSQPAQGIMQWQNCSAILEGGGDCRPSRYTAGQVANSMENLIVNNLETYGVWAVFVLLMLSGIGIPLGEDLVIIPAGVLVNHGHLPPWSTLAAAYLGVVLSDIMWFLVCRHYGTPLLHKKWFKRLVHPRRLLEAKHQMEQRGAWMIVMARFIPASRTTAITVAGMLHLPVWKFILATSCCVCITAPLQLGAGWLIGQGIGSQSAAGSVKVIIGLIVMSVAVAIGANIYRQHRAGKQRVPRAKVRWLKRFRPPRKRLAGVKR
jgi:membrane protein DedA with SNARE-associated domain